MPSTETRPIESDADTGEDDGYAHYAGSRPVPVPGLPALQGARRPPRRLTAPAAPAPPATRAVTTPPASPATAWIAGWLGLRGTVTRKIQSI